MESFGKSASSSDQSTYGGLGYEIVTVQKINGIAEPTLFWPYSRHSRPGKEQLEGPLDRWRSPRRSNRRQGRIHRSSTQHSHDLAIHLPGVAEMRAGVVQNLENQHLTFPDGLARKHFLYDLPSEKSRPSAIGRFDGTLEIGYRNVIHLVWIRDSLARREA